MPTWMKYGSVFLIGFLAGKTPDFFSHFANALQSIANSFH